MAAAPVVPAERRPVVILVDDPTQGAKVYQFPSEEGAADFEDKTRGAGGGATLLRLLPPPPASAQTLYEIEEHLAALADSVETVSPDQEQAFLGDFQAALMTAADKRDRMAQFMAHCESQAALAKKEIERLTKRQKFYERTVARLESYVAMVIVSLGLDAKGKYRKLEGETVTFSVRRNPPSVAIEDEGKVLDSYKRVTISMPMKLWEELGDAVPFELRDRLLEAKRLDSDISKTALKEAIEKDVPGWKDQLASHPFIYSEKVPGAAIAAGTLRLVRD